MASFDFDAFAHYLVNAYLLGGILVTLWLTFLPIVAGMLLGTVLALMRMSGRIWLSGVARFYVWVFRGTPLLVQLVLIYTGLPQIGVKFGVVTSALLSLTLNEAAYLSEILRAGLGAVPQGQRDAAAALGLRPWTVFAKVVWPQAMRLIIPPLGNSVNGLLKATSLASVISMEELMRRGQVLMQVKFEVLEVYSVIALYYLALTTLWDLVQAPLERRYARGYAPVAAVPRGEA
jgi:polar amino acid transport system permease protein